jgi:hypothetical protein
MKFAGVLYSCEVARSGRLEESEASASQGGGGEGCSVAFCLRNPEEQKQAFARLLGNETNTRFARSVVSASE